MLLGNWIFIIMAKKRTQKNTIITKIAVSTMIAIFSLASAFAGTYAWFTSMSPVSVSGATFKIKSPNGIQFDLYYLHHFAVDQSTNKNGNYNYDTDIFAGYEIAYANPVFVQVNYDSDGSVSDLNDPTNISHLWPAHKTTYAIVVTSGTLNSFSLDSWDEVRLPSVLTQVNDQDVEISLSWAIDMFGAAYYISSTATVEDDIATGFTSYLNDNAITDKFLYSQTNIAPAVKPSINIVDSISGASGDNKRVILYFSIEFSDDSSTYYTYNAPYYVKNTSGNSNCYENLSLTDLVFKLA